MSQTRRGSTGLLVVMLVYSGVTGLAGCATPSQVPPTPSPSAHRPDAIAAVAAIRAAGAAQPQELVVQPLGDPQLTDLREQAVRLEAQGAYREAADALDRALSINADDPALLQERAEAALLLQDLPMATQLAQRAFTAGSRVGPLCRRSRETLAQIVGIRLEQHARTPVPADPQHAADHAAAQVALQAEQHAANGARDACTIVAPPRY